MGDSQTTPGKEVAAMVHVLDVLAKILAVLVQAVTLITVLAKTKGAFRKPPRMK